MCNLARVHTVQTAVHEPKQQYRKRDCMTQTMNMRNEYVPAENLDTRASYLDILRLWKASHIICVRYLLSALADICCNLYCHFGFKMETA